MSRQALRLRVACNQGVSEKSEATERCRSNCRCPLVTLSLMAGYVVYVNVDQLQLGTEPSVTTTFARSGFRKIIRRDKMSSPLATLLLFVGDSSFNEKQLARHLEKKLRYDTMCDVYVIVFPLKVLGSRPDLRMQSKSIEKPLAGRPN